MLYYPSHRFQPPLSAAARAVSASVQRRRYAAQRTALVPQSSNVRQRSLLGRVGF
jgi:hypothetical protein